MFYLLNGSGNGGSAGGGLLSIGIIILFVVVFYFLFIRPQKKQDRELARMRDSIVVGDEITTIGGIIGKVVSVKEETCIIETGRDHVRIRILKSAIRCVDVHAEDAE